MGAAFASGTSEKIFLAPTKSPENLKVNSLVVTVKITRKL